MLKTIYCWLSSIILLVLAADLVLAQDQLDEAAIIDSVFLKVNTIDSAQRKIIELESQANYIYDFAPFTKVFIDSAMAIAIRENLAEEVVIALFNYMQYHVFHAEFDSAKWYYEKAMALNIVVARPAIQADFDGQMATLLKKEGNTKAAITHFLSALAILESPTYKNSLSDEAQLETFRSLCVLHNNLANLYKDLKDFSAASKHYDDAFELLLAMDEKGLAGTVLMNKGSAFLEREVFDSAYMIQVEAKRLKVEGEGSIRSIAMSDLNIGNALKGLDRLAEAKAFMNQALAAFKELENATGLADTYIGRGLLQIEEKSYRAAVMDCQRSYNIARAGGLLDQQQKASACLYRGYKALGKYALALRNHERLKILSDSLRNDENTKFVTQLEMQYDFDRQEENRLVGENAAALLQLEKDRRNKRALTVLVALLVISLLSAYLIFRNFQIKKRAEKALAQKNTIISKSLEEKELLIKEIHHRVKNNLQVISSLLRLQSKYIDDDAALDAITAGRSRVQSMALLHENLYQDDNLTGVDMKQYFDRLIDGLFTTLNIAKERVVLKKEIDAIQLDIDSVVPVGLITNELITNALKHAFTDQEQGVLTVRLFEENDKLHLEVADNGKGMSSDIFENERSSFGHKLIRAFAAKLDADLSVVNEGGTTVRFVISQYERAA